MKIFISLLLLLAFIKGLSDFIYFLVNLKWLKDENRIIKKSRIDDAISLPYFHILLPVLREQGVLEDTVAKLLSIDYPKAKFKIYIITTEKEIYEKKVNRIKIKELAQDLSAGTNIQRFKEKYLGLFNEAMLEKTFNKYNGRKDILENLYKEYDSYEDTIKLTNKLVVKYNNIYNTESLSNIHFPYKTGVIAHQVNYAAKMLISDKLGSKSDYIAVYNADSSINKDSLKVAAKIIIDNMGKNFIIQQSALFVKNYNRLRLQFLKAGGLFQTYWTISTEITRIRSQYKKIRKLNLNNFFSKIFFLRLAHCVGHGLIINLELFKKLGYFSTYTINEDLPFGFMLSVNKIPIIPLPVLESADTPTTFLGLINQKKVWFYSYLEYYKYRNYLLKQGVNKTVLDILLIQGLWYGMIWLFNSFIFFLPLIISLVFLDYNIIIFSLLLLCLFVYLPFFILITKIKFIYSYADKNYPQIKYFEYIITPFFCLLVLFTDSFDPLLSVIEKLKNKLTQKDIIKKKTER